MKKKVLIPLFVFLFVVFLFFVLLFLSSLWAKKQKKGGPDDFLIQQNEQKKIIENKREGISFEIPSYFFTRTSQDSDGQSWAITFYPPGQELLFPEKEYLEIFKNGYLFEVRIDKSEGSQEMIKYLSEVYQKEGLPSCQNAKDIVPSFLEHNQSCVLKVKDRVFFDTLRIEKDPLGIILQIATPLNHYKSLFIYFSCAPLAQKDFCYQKIQEFLDNLRFSKPL